MEGLLLSEITQEPMVDGRSILSVGISYKPVRGGVAAVENTYSTFCKPYNHVASASAGGRLNKLFYFLLAVLKFLGWMLFRREIKIVHIHGASNASFWRKRVFIYLAYAFGKKIVYHVHGGKFNFFAQKHMNAVEKTISKCDCIVALSESWKEYFNSTFPNVRVEIIHNVIENPVKKKQNRQEFTLLFMGLLGQNKGIYDLLDVIKENKSYFGGRLRLLIGGNGEVNKVKATIDRDGLSDIVSYEGWVSGKRKQNLFNMSDALILPSYNEGLPLCVLEALSYDIPVIATRVGGIPEIVHNEKNGYLIEPGDKNAMYMAIVEAMENRYKPIRGGVETYLPSYVAVQLNTLYKSLLS